LLDSRFSPSMRADVKERDLSDQQKILTLTI
jgi:hypothetical protein